MEMNQVHQKKSGFNKKWLLLLISVVLFFMLLVVAGAGYAAYRYLMADEESIETVEIQTISTAQAINILDGEELSLSRIQDVEQRVAHDGTTEQENVLDRRIKALKHVYTECFLVKDHSVQRLKGVYMLRSGELSVQQLNTLRWFFSLSPSDQEQFEFIEGNIENFVDFRAKMREEIEKKKNN